MIQVIDDHAYPKLHNAAWPGLVGKGGKEAGAEPFIDLDTMINLTAGAEVNGIKFDGIDLFLFDPHVSIDASDDNLKRLADKLRAKNLVVGSVVAPIWKGTDGGSAMGDARDRRNFLTQVKKACWIAKKLRDDIEIRPHGVVRIDSESSVENWSKDPQDNQRRIADTFRQACSIAADNGEKLAAEGEICWGGMHTWRRMLQLLEMVDRPGTLGFQADMAHTLLYMIGYNETDSEHALLMPPEHGAPYGETSQFQEAYRTLTDHLRSWTIDFHVAQNDCTVKGSGSHDKTGKHCLPNDPNGKLNIRKHSGYWLRDHFGSRTRKLRHICWDGCMFPNEVMMNQQTWNDVLTAMIAVRDAHGWSEEPEAEAA